jgi:hypothetical protein
MFGIEISTTTTFGWSFANDLHVRLPIDEELETLTDGLMILGKQDANLPHSVSFVCCPSG